MAKQKVVVIGPPGDPLEHERAEMEDLDVEFIQADPQSEGEAMELVREADAIMMRSGRWGSEQVIGAAKKAQVLAVYSHGFNHIDVEACTDNGIILTNGAGMCAEEVSNQAVTFVLALNRQVVQTTTQLRGGTWDVARNRPIDPLDLMTLGIIGFGNIGRQIARKLGAWRMPTLVYDPYIPPWITHEYGVEQAYELNDIFRRADYIVTIVPLNDETFHMIGREQFDLMKPSAFFVNVCRGAVVDESALIEALQKKKMRGAGLDVFEKEPADPNNPLFKMDNVICAPHIAGTSTRSAWLSRQRAAQQVAAVLRGEWPQAAQNPEVASKMDARKRALSRVGKING
jgi:phosphoglycerate dehydrogenase-like enzyme